MNELGRDLLRSAATRRSEVLFVYNCEPAGDDAQPGGGWPGAFAAATCSPSCTNKCGRTRRSWPTSCYPPPPSSSTRSFRAGVRGLRHPPRRAAAVEPAGEARSNNRGSSPSSSAGSISTARATRKPWRAMPSRLLAAGAPGGGPPRPRGIPAWRHPPDGTNPVQFVDVFPLTADRKIHLVPEALDREAPEGLYALGARPRLVAGFPADADLARHQSHSVSSTLAELWDEPAHVEGGARARRRRLREIARIGRPSAGLERAAARSTASCECSADVRGRGASPSCPRACGAGTPSTAPPPRPWPPTR